jgi:hypothetical protein
MSRLNKRYFSASITENWKTRRTGPPEAPPRAKPQSSEFHCGQRSIETPSSPASLVPTPQFRLLPRLTSKPMPKWNHGNYLLSDIHSGSRLAAPAVHSVSCDSVDHPRRTAGSRQMKVVWVVNEAVTGLDLPRNVFCCV